MKKSMSIGVIPFTALIAVLGFFNCEALAASLTTLQFESAPRSWVGRGQSRSVTPEDNFSFSASRNFDNGVSFRINNLVSNPPRDSKYWTLNLAAPFEALLTPGLYSDTARFPFQSAGQPGLTFSGNHRGNNRNGGFFEVLEATYLADGTVASFAVDFTQYGEQQQERWINGKLRFNSNIALDGSIIDADEPGDEPKSVPESSATLGMGLALGFSALVLVGKKK
ncbi:hypothetical protein IQ249_14930 [Lusitaniella coriacea LEGE 07157]|uniref:Uncharacterized protein n=1 Tax=Lusitaniella coriacea LEGE 07157 TaxID=945747 RepID=A0A8J7IVE0_9CYAN|nr:hypothetical protein [Lusitaniella coriacea]MBE9117193.1 hypothetical protein [Lusitaniella coriacea LEGE 07157]